MSSPFTDWSGQYGVGSPAYKKQLDDFNATRDAFYQSLVQRIQASQGVQPTQGLTTAQAASGPDQSAQRYSDPDLVAAGVYWGLPENVAAAMPRDQLSSYVDEKRSHARPQEDTFAQRIGAAPAMLGSIPGMMLVGAAEGITGGLQRLPLVGEALGRVQAIHGADMWLRKLEEGIRSSTPESFQPALSALNVIGNVASMWVPGNAAWKVAGVAGKVLPVARTGRYAAPIIRLAFQGAASSWLLEGGSDFAKENPGTFTAVGAAGGLAFEALAAGFRRSGPFIQGAMNKVSKAFQSDFVTDIRTAAMPGPRAGSVPSDLRAFVSEATTKTNAEHGMLQSLYDVINNPASTEEQRITAQTLLDNIGARGSRPYPVFERGNPTPEVMQRMGMTEEEIAEHFARQAAFAPEPAGITTQEASSMAAQHNKQADVIGSPVLAEAAGASQIDEVTVAQAIMETTPGGSGIVEGIPDPPSFVERFGSAIEAGHMRFATRKGSNTLDAIISDQPITDEMVSQYETHGFYESQTVQTPSGQDGVIKSIQGDKAVIQRPFSNLTTRVKLSRLMPSTQSPGYAEVPGGFEEYSAYLQKRANEIQEAMGGAMTQERANLVVEQNRPQYTEDFLDALGIADQGTRARIKNSLSRDWISTLQATHAPEEAKVQQAAAEYLSFVQEHAPEPTPQARLDSKAAAKGFVIVPDGRTGTFEVRDIGVSGNGTASPTRMTFESRDAAETWISKVNRELPDVTPAGPVPVEIAGALPTAGIHEPTLNPAHLDEAHTEIASDIAETIARAEGVPHEVVNGDLQARIDEVRALGRNNLGRVHELLTDSWARYRPTRNAMASLQNILRDNGINLDLFKDWDLLATARTVKQNWAHPWHDRWAEMMNVFRQEDMRTGKVTELFMAGDKATENRLAEQYGFTPEMQQTVENMRQFFRELRPHDTLDSADEIAKWLSHVRSRQSAGFDAERALEYPADNPILQPFIDHVKGAGMSLREMDPRNLGTAYINALGFETHMRPLWEQSIPKWEQIGREVPELEPVAKMFGNWANLIRHGYNPGNDTTLNVIHGVMKFFVPGITKLQARQIFNDGLTTTHLALLGYRPDVWARDSIQLLLAAPRVGTDLFATMMNYAKGSEAFKQEMWERAMKHSFVQLGLPRIAAPGMFEEATSIAAADMAEAAVQARKRGWRYGIAQKVGDVLHDITPQGLRNIQNTPWHPLYVYTKQGERMRLFVAEAGFQRTSRALATFRAAGPEASMDRLMGESAARTFDPAVQERFQQLVASGNDEEAAAFIGRQLADATQFRYGSAEMPEAARSTAGRIGMQMGNFSSQFAEYLNESMRNSWQHPGDAVKFLSMLGSVTLALDAAKEATGWNFNKWQYWGALTFTGGPWAQAGADAFRGLNAMSQVLSGYGGQTALQNTGLLADAALNVASYVNPAGGIVRQARGLYGISQSPNPAAATGRMLLTGEIGPGPDWAAQQREYNAGMPPVLDMGSPHIMNMAPNPVRSNSVGLPQAPPAPAVVYPWEAYMQPQPVPGPSPTPHPGSGAQW